MESEFWVLAKTFFLANLSEIGVGAAVAVALVEVVFKPLRWCCRWLFRRKSSVVRQRSEEPTPAPAPPTPPTGNPTIIGVVERLEARVAVQAEQLGVQKALVHDLARRYAEGNPEDFDGALRGIERALEVAHVERQRGALPSNLPDAVEAVLRQVDALNEAGDLGKGLQTLERELQARADEVERRQAEQVRLCEKGVAQAVLARDAEAACRFELARLDIEASGDAAERFEALRRVQDEWYKRGRDKGLNFDLEVAIALAHACLERARSADDRGTAGNDLGLALWVLGERESGTARLEEAVAAFRAALQERARELVPLDWAGTQNNLGNALSVLGQRESGTARLDEAVDAYRAALQEWTQERVPLDWAMTQNNLGNALWALGERESGTARLEEAVAAYRAALEEWTRERVPLYWAATQNNLGNALWALGERESGTARLEEAVDAYRAALEERTRERVPLDWAATQNNLGEAKVALFGKTGERRYLEEALACYDAGEPVFAEAAPYYAEKLAKNKARALALRDEGADAEGGPG